MSRKESVHFTRYHLYHFIVEASQFCLYSHRFVCLWSRNASTLLVDVLKDIQLEKIPLHNVEQFSQRLWGSSAKPSKKRKRPLKLGNNFGYVLSKLNNWPLKWLCEATAVEIYNKQQSHFMVVSVGQPRWDDPGEPVQDQSEMHQPLQPLTSPVTCLPLIIFFISYDS